MIKYMYRKIMEEQGLNGQYIYEPISQMYVLNIYMNVFPNNLLTFSNNQGNAN